MPAKLPDYNLQTRPTYNWRVISTLRQNTGGFNGGINVVEDRSDPGKTYIEKIATREFVKEGLIDQEIVILRELAGHPHITEMVDQYVDRRTRKASIYMEHCTKEGLESFITARRETGEYFNEIDIWQWFIQLFDALAYCHCGPDKDNKYKKIVEGQEADNDWNAVWHRDIKPPNILVTEGNRPGQDVAIMFKIGYFGCALTYKTVWVENWKNRRRGSFETLGWQPPEAPSHNMRSDVWQLGAIIGCLCTLTQVAQDLDPKKPAPGYTSTLNEAIKTCINPDHTMRPDAPEVLQYITKKYGELRPALEQHPRPNPATIQSGTQTPGRGFRFPGNNPRNNMGPSRFSMRPGLRPGGRPMGIPDRAPRVRRGRRRGQPRPGLGGLTSRPSDFSGIPDPRFRQYMGGGPPRQYPSSPTDPRFGPQMGRGPGMARMDPRGLRGRMRGYTDPMGETAYYSEDEDDDDDEEDDDLPYINSYGYGGHGGYGGYGRY